jgi:hypothetical protein
VGGIKSIRDFDKMRGERKKLKNADLKRGTGLRIPWPAIISSLLLFTHPIISIYSRLNNLKKLIFV